MISSKPQNAPHIAEGMDHISLNTNENELFTALLPQEANQIKGIIDDVMVFKVSSPQDETYNRFIKRGIDVIFSLFILVFVFSWLCPLLAILIKMESRGPVIFKQLRSGKNNAEFWCYKFRSMRINEDAHHRQACRNDDRTTRIGRFLRRTSLDEFPQFLNVIAGDMSVVGPRPHMIKHTEEYRYIIDNYMVRHYLKPGITGWAQINGHRGETAGLDAMQKRIHHDLWYLENWSVLLDIRIILSTSSQVLFGHKNAF